VKMDEYFCRPLPSLALRGRRDRRRMRLAAEARKVHAVAGSSCTFAMRIALRRRRGARVIHSCLGVHADDSEL